MAVRGQDIASVIKKQIEGFGSDLAMVDVGSVIEVGDGIARVHGLSGVAYNELVEFEGGIAGIALNLEEDSVGIVILGDPLGIKEGTEVRGTGQVMQVPVGQELLGRVVDGIGSPIDGKGPVETNETREVEIVAPNVAIRQSVDTPVQTGIKAIDAMIPIGRGQRELIIGDRTTGKTAICVDAIINQKGGDLTCIYVSVGQKVGKVAQTVGTLEQFGALDHTIVVAANASDSAPMQYLAPYTGCAMAEYFMAQGKDVLIVYDDLSKHAWAYRQMSLLLKRPPGREAYPGDVFYLHSRLLERAARVNAEYVEKFTEGKVKGKTGSLTALPIVETQEGDISAFVPTNVISITDGQIFLETSLFSAGLKPAMDPGISVSRVGGAAQLPIIKKLGGGIRTALAQYRELEAFSQFASDLDDASREQLEHGTRVTELMKQGQNSPMSVSEMGAVLFAANEGYLKEVEVEKIKDFEKALLAYLHSEHTELMKTVAETGDYGDGVAAEFKEALDNFVSTQAY